MSDKKAYFKIEFPTFNELSTELQQIIREGAAQAKLCVFSSGLDSETHDVGPVEMQIQWPNSEDENTFYYIPISDVQDAHQTRYIYEEVQNHQCKLSLCNTKLYLQNKNSGEREDINVLVIVRTIFNGNSLATSDLKLDVLKYDHGETSSSVYEPNTLLFETSLNKPTDEGEFTLKSKYYNKFDLNELIANGYLYDYFYAYSSSDLANKECTIVPEKLYIEKRSILDCGYVDKETIKGAIALGDIPLYITSIEEIPKSLYTIDNNSIIINDESVFDSDHYRDFYSAYKASDVDTIKEVSGKLSFRQSSIEMPNRWYFSRIEIENSSVSLSFAQLENPLDIHNTSFDWDNDWLYNNYGIETYINNQPVAIVGIKSYNKNKNVYVSGDQASGNNVTKFDLVNRGGDNDGGENDIVTAYVLKEAPYYLPAPEITSLYLAISSGGAPIQNRVTNATTYKEPAYKYALYTNAERTNLFKIDRSKDYQLVSISYYGVVTYANQDTTSRVCTSLADMPSSTATDSTFNLYELQDDSTLWLASNYDTYYTRSIYKYRYDYVVSDKENYTPTEDVKETTLYFDSAAQVQPNITPSYQYGLNTSYVTRAYTNVSLFNRLIKYDYSKDYEVGYYNENDEWVKLPGSMAELPESTDNEVEIAYVVLDWGDIWLCSNSTDVQTVPRNNLILREKKKAQQYYSLYIRNGGSSYGNSTIGANSSMRLTTYAGNTNYPDILWDGTDSTLPHRSIYKILNSAGKEIDSSNIEFTASDTKMAIINNGDQRTPDFRTVLFTLDKPSYMCCLSISSQNEHAPLNVNVVPGSTYSLIDIDNNVMLYETGSAYRVLGVFEVTSGRPGKPLITDWDNMQYLSLQNINGKITLVSSLSSSLQMAFVWFYKV